MDGTVIPLNLFTPCENCGGEGGWSEEPYGYWDICPCCEGTGEVPSSERELISLKDLEAINKDKPPC